MDELRTDRLLLRHWRPDDESAMAAINRHPDVGRYLNRPVDDASVDAFYGVIVGHWETHGFGAWAVEYHGRFVGFAGLAHVPPFLAEAGTAPELGWRLSPDVWGHGLATEAATAARDDAFGRLRMSEIISIIHPQNTRSQRVATKLGLSRHRQIHNPALGIPTDIWRAGA
ncbi:GNAT family N-acetyltransferase [Cryptosporangium sp. NPDC048952]|uniref:GNAT family N-acetyltransferase n=1 Tax=Cryptosporangium sp. NPDC048952 TaxID=3363961 RepID=UPI003719C97A